MTFDTELETYRKLEEELLRTSDGKFALIAGAELLGTFDTYEDAATAGYLKCGVDRVFMVHHICKPQQGMLNSHLFRPRLVCP